MKNLLLALTFLTIGFKSFAQDLRCIAAPSYLVETGPNEKKVNSPASVCYYGRYFSFYTKATNTITFEVFNPTTTTNKDGVMEETFLNAQNDHNAHGDYAVDIVYGKTKTVVISFTKFGQAYVIRSDGFLGSPENDPGTKTMAGNLKTDKLGFQHSAVPPVDVSKWFMENTDVAEFKTVPGKIECYFLIKPDGSIKNITIQQLLFRDSEKLPDNVGERILATLFKMPNWKPGRDSENNTKLSQVYMVIKVP